MQQKRIEANTLIVMLVLVGIVSLVVTFISSMKKDTVVSVETSIEQSESVQSGVPKDWKKHIGDGYTVQYPIDWFLLPSSGITVVSSYDSEATQGSGSFTKLELAKPQVMPQGEFDTFIANRVSNYKVDSRFSDVTYMKESNIKVAGMPTTIISMKNTSSGTPYYTHEFVVRLQNSRYFFVTLHQGKPEISPLVTQILTAITLP